MEINSVALIGLGAMGSFLRRGWKHAWEKISSV